MDTFSVFSQKAQEIALSVGTVLQSGFHTQFSMHAKGRDCHNLVTEYDEKSEAMIIQFLSKNFPDHNILSEEKGSIDKNSSYKWVIDPLDGTVNFAHGIPVFAISIALLENNSPIMGLVYQPITNEIFVAEKGKGAFRNEKKITVSQESSLEKTFLATGFPYNISGKASSVVYTLKNFLQKGIPIRRLGAAAIDLAYTAAGYFDGFWEGHLGPWDCAAGALLIEEAGGKVTDWQGNPFILRDKNDILASNRKIHDQMVSIIKA